MLLPFISPEKFFPKVKNEEPKLKKLKIYENHSPDRG